MIADILRYSFSDALVVVLFLLYVFVVVLFLADDRFFVAVDGAWFDSALFDVGREVDKDVGREVDKDEEGSLFAVVGRSV